MLPCFSPANSELFIAMNSPDDSLLLSWASLVPRLFGGGEKKSLVSTVYACVQLFDIPKFLDFSN